MSIQLIHEGGKHNKFWSSEIRPDHTVITRWGRLGTKGQSKTFEFNSDWAAQDFIDKKVTEKLRKGYREVEPEILDLKKLQAELTGPEYKIKYLKFVKPRSVEENVYDANVYDAIQNEVALADPNYKPMIYCELRLTRPTWNVKLLIDTQKVYMCNTQGTWPTTISRSWVNSKSDFVVIIEDKDEITDDSSYTYNATVRKIVKKVPGIVQAIFQQPQSI